MGVSDCSMRTVDGRIALRFTEEAVGGDWGMHLQKTEEAPAGDLVAWWSVT